MEVETSLKKLSAYDNVKILTPDMVIRELIEQKKRSLVLEKDKLSKSPLMGFMNSNNNQFTNDVIRTIMIDSDKLKLTESAEIPFKILSIPDNKKAVAFDEIISTALRKEPPFELRDGTDKGFKDACIAKEIEYNISCFGNSDTTFFVSNDSLLSAYIRGKHNFRIANKLQGVRVKLHTTNGAYIDRIDSGADDMEKARKLIYDYSMIDNFKTTHQAIRDLTPIKDKLSAQDKALLLLLSAHNRQVYWIVSDNDVKAFLEFLMKDYDKNIVGEFTINRLKNYMNDLEY